MLSQNVAKGIQQLLNNAGKLLEVYVRTKDESLVSIIQGLLSAAQVELDDAVGAGIQISLPVEPYPSPQEPGRPILSPTVVMYGAWTDPVFTSDSTWLFKTYPEDKPKP